MRKLCLACSLILGFSVLAFSQGPVQVGYAVVTPTSLATGVTTSGMVVFETFGLNRGGETTQAGILPPDLTTNAVLFVSASGRLSRDLGVAIVNPQNTSVNVAMTLRRDDGTQVKTVTIPLTAHQQIARFVTELFAGQPSIPSDFVGTLTLTPSAPVSIIGLRFRGLNFSTIPITNLSPDGAVPIITTGVGGTGAILLPQFAAGGGWGTELVIVNTGSTALTVRVDLFKPDGTPLSATLNGTSGSSFTGIIIQPGGVAVLAQRNAGGDSDF